MAAKYDGSGIMRLGDLSSSNVRLGSFVSCPERLSAQEGAIFAKVVENSGVFAIERANFGRFSRLFCAEAFTEQLAMAWDQGS
jgi:hypothetical protein